MGTQERQGVGVTAKWGGPLKSTPRAAGAENTVAKLCVCVCVCARAREHDGEVQEECGAYGAFRMEEPCQ